MRQRSSYFSSWGARRFRAASSGGRIPKPFPVARQFLFFSVVEREPPETREFLRRLRGPLFRSDFENERRHPRPSPPRPGIVPPLNNYLVHLAVDSCLPCELGPYFRDRAPSRRHKNAGHFDSLGSVLIPPKQKQHAPGILKHPTGERLWERRAGLHPSCSHPFTPSSCSCRSYYFKHRYVSYHKTTFY